MGPAKLAGVLSIVGRQSAAARGEPYDKTADAAVRAQGGGTDRGRVPGVLPVRRSIDAGGDRPARYSPVLGLCLSVVDGRPATPALPAFGVFRP